MKPKLAINGFGRIGRTIAKINCLQQHFDLVAINDIDPYIENMAYLFKYDSTYGKFEGDVVSDNDSIVINGQTAKYLCNSDIADVDWAGLGVDVIIDSSGVAHNVLSARQVAEVGSVDKIVVTHSSDNVDREVILGVNEHELRSDDRVLSNSICDANAIAHVMRWLDEEYGIETGSVTTLHPWLSYQNLTDGPAISQSQPGVVWKDFALGRASTDSLIPKNTTAMTAVEKVLPQLKGKVMSFSYRVPTDIVASSDITLKLKGDVNQSSLYSFLKEKVDASPYVRMNTESLVSLDYEKDSHSAILDGQWIKAENGLVKVVLWYDNEWGYSARALDLARYAVGFPK
ncbi:type I glyceraldehyde-3-phosphate dehydrogenase [Pseudomonadota bacterium]